MRSKPLTHFDFLMEMKNFSHYLILDVNVPLDYTTLIPFLNNYAQCFCLNVLLLYPSVGFPQFGGFTDD